MKANKQPYVVRCGTVEESDPSWDFAAALRAAERLTAIARMESEVTCAGEFFVRVTPTRA